MSGTLSAADLHGAQHRPGGAAHLVVLGVLVVIALVVFGVNRWRRKRAAAAAEQPDDRSAGTTDSTEES